MGLGWVAVLVGWVTTKTLADLGFLRSRWTCAVLALLLRKCEGVLASRETVRRLLHRGHLVYRRPGPIPPPNDDERRVRPVQLRALLEGLLNDETVVWQDEVEVHTNPKDRPDVDAQGAPGESPDAGHQAQRYLAGSIHWRTGQVFSPRRRPSRVAIAK